MRTRFADSRPVRLVVMAALVAVLAPLAVLAGPVPDASACSFMPESLEVSPSPEVMPGDWLTVRGSGFIDISYEPVEPEIDPDTGLPVPLNSCAGLVIEPKDPVVIMIAGHVVMSVTGPDFEVDVQVPGDAAPGPTRLSAGSAVVELVVGSTGPEPCPVYVAQGAPVGQQVLPPGCLDPCGLDGGLAEVWCPPEPCPAYTDGAALQVWPPECPDPCGLVRPAIGDWRCPPEPCPVYLAQGAPVGQQVLPPGCPDPCGGVGGDAVWCPPEPCPVYTDGAALQVWPPKCPDPCGFDGGPAGNRAVCPPEPCDPEDAVGVWCPQPCRTVGDGAVVCGDPAPVPVRQVDRQQVPASEPRQEPIAAPDTAETTQDPPKADAPVATASRADDRTELAPMPVAVDRLHERSVEAVRELLAIASLGVFGGPTD